jgi:protein gp37
MNDSTQNHRYPHILNQKVANLQAEIVNCREWTRGVLTGGSAPDNFTTQQTDDLRKLMIHLVSASPEDLMHIVSTMNTAFRHARDGHPTPNHAANDALDPNQGHQKAARHDACGLG